MWPASRGSGSGSFGVLLLPLQAPLALELRPGGRSRGFNEKQNRKKQKETVGRSLSFSSRGMQGAWWQNDPPRLRWRGWGDWAMRASPWPAWLAGL